MLARASARRRDAAVTNGMSRSIEHLGEATAQARAHLASRSSLLCSDESAIEVDAVARKALTNNLASIRVQSLFLHGETFLCLHAYVASRALPGERMLPPPQEMAETKEAQRMEFQSDSVRLQNLARKSGDDKARCALHVCVNVRAHSSTM